MGEIGRINGEEELAWRGPWAAMSKALLCFVVLS